MLLLQKFLSVQVIACGCCIMFGLAYVSPVMAGAHPVSAPVAHTVSLAQSQGQIMEALANSDTPFYLNILAPLYASRGMQPMWQDGQAVQQFQQQLVEVALSGVQPQFNQWVKLLTAPSMTGMGRDVVLSDAMLGYLQFTSGVSSKGEVWLYSNAPYKLEAPSTAMISQWQNALAQGRLNDFVLSLTPGHPQYSRMQQALKTLLADKRPWPQLTDRRTLHPGQVSNDIPALRDILQRTEKMMMASEPPKPTDEVVGEVDVPLVHDDDNDQLDGGALANRNVVVSSSATATSDILQLKTPNSTDNVPNVVASANGDDVYTPQITAALKRFQNWQGLEADGVIGARTREWLNVSPQLRVSLIALNIQRLRLLPDDMHNGIMVNIPNYSLVYYANGKEILSSRVIVGRPDRRTPLMRSALNNVVLNPPWNVPTTLVRKDIVPKVKLDPNYLYKHDYTLLSGWGSDAEVINPSMINWARVSAASFPYRIRQAPGATNSLGRYKFNMPNSDAIYLHDTPNHDLFRKDIRALSSGCVRVNQASDLANLLLQDVGWSETRISSTLKEGNTRYVSIRQRIPVNLYYLTAWVADNGQLQFRTDIYNYDNSAHSGVQIVARAGQLLRY